MTESAGKDFSFFLLSFSFLAQFGAVNGNFFDPSCVILTHLFEARGEGGSLCSKETDTKVGVYDCGVSSYTTKESLIIRLVLRYVLLNL